MLTCSKWDKTGSNKHTAKALHVDYKHFWVFTKYSFQQSDDSKIAAYVMESLS